MWISITKLLPIEKSPPLLSVFWAIPWLHAEYSEQVVCLNCLAQVEIQDGRARSGRKKYRDLKYSELADIDMKWHNDLGYFPMDFDVQCECDEAPVVQGKRQKTLFTKKSAMLGFGAEHNWAGAVKIVHQGRDVRVFPDEYNELNDEMLAERLEAYELVAEDAPKSALVAHVLDTDAKILYEFALIEGASHNIAIQVATGGNIDEDQLTDVEPIGWYRLLPEYQAYF